MKLSWKHIVCSLLILFACRAVAAEGDLDSRDKYGLGEFINAELNDLDRIDVVGYVTEFDMVLQKLKVKQTQYRSEVSFLRHIFYTVHRKLLGEYDQYSLFSDLFEKNSTYDCVTASVLYSLILKELEIPHTVRETDYHVYVLAYAGDNEVFIETTDPLNGFVTDPEEVEFRKSYYSGQRPEKDSRDSMIGLASENPDYQNTGFVDNDVASDELAGLLYYNQAIKAFNSGDFHRAHNMIKRAQEIHPTQRIKKTASYIFSVGFTD